MIHWLFTGPLGSKTSEERQGQSLGAKDDVNPGISDHSLAQFAHLPKLWVSKNLQFFTWRAKVASSKGFCIWPGPNIPRSPPFLALLQSLNSLASSLKRCNSSVVNFDIPQKWPPLPQFWLCTQQEFAEPPPDKKGDIICVSQLMPNLTYYWYHVI